MQFQFAGGYWDNDFFAAAPLTASGPYGQTHQGCSIGGVRTTTITTLNIDRLGSVSSTFRRSVANHELGHHIGIRHSTVSPAVMNSGRDRETVYLPQVDDVCGVNHRYPSTGWPPTCGY